MPHAIVTTSVDVSEKKVANWTRLFIDKNWFLWVITKPPEEHGRILKLLISILTSIVSVDNRLCSTHSHISLVCGTFEQLPIIHN